MIILMKNAHAFWNYYAYFLSVQWNSNALRQNLDFEKKERRKQNLLVITEIQTLESNFY